MAILPVCSLLRAAHLVEGTISLVPFLPPVPVPAVFAVIPLMVVPVVAVVVPSLVSFISLSSILTAIVLKTIAGLDAHRGNKCDTRRTDTYLCIRCMSFSSARDPHIGIPVSSDCTLLASSSMFNTDHCIDRLGLLPKSTTSISGCSGTHFPPSRLCGGIVCPRKRARGRTGRYGSPGFISAASAAESRSWCGSVRKTPVCS